jgi:RNA-directed DNA polymerase
MKRINDLYKQIYSYDNLLLAHNRARKGKGHYKEVELINSDPEKYLLQIQTNLINKTYKTSNYDVLERMEGRKIRVIHKLPYFPDRIVHHAIMNVVGDLWVKTLIRDTYQSIKGRGVHLAMKRIVGNMGKDTKYCLKIDITKYYPSVDNEILKGIIRKKIKDSNLLWLLDEIIDSTKGLPIGNYLSQIFGNLYLSGFDHWIKEQKRIKYYYRYCDDCIFLSDSKMELHKLKTEVVSYLRCNLKLEVKGDWQIFPIDSRGIDFLGYKFYTTHTLIRKSIKTDFSKKISMIRRNWTNLTYFEVINRIKSYSGWMQHANCYNLETYNITNDIKYIMEIKTSAKKFGDFAKIDGHVEGDKLKMADVVNKEITITGYSTKDSKYNKNKSGKYLSLEFILDDQKRILFTGSDVLIEQIEKYSSEIPFVAIIKNINKFYTLS